MKIARALVVVGLLAATLRGQDDPLVSLFDTGQLDELIASAGERLALDAGDDSAQFWLGRAWLARADELRAASTFGFAADLADSSLSRAIDAFDGVEGELYDESRDWQAWARFLKVGADADFGRELEAWFAESNHAYAAELRARQLVMLADADAADWYGRAVEAGAEDPGVALEWAVQLAVAGRSDEALAAWETTTNASPFERMGTLLSVLPGTENAEQRLELVRDVIREAGLEASALAAWHEAFAQRQLERSEEAADTFARVENADDAPLGFERSHAALLSSLGRFDEAADRLEQAVAYGDIEARDALRGVGDELAILRRHDEALAIYDRVLQAEPNEGVAMRNRALALSYAGRVEEAQKAWDALLDRSPRSPDLLNDAALCAAGWGDHGRARVLWERAVPLYGSSDARENLAHALVAENPARATSLAESVLADEPARNRALFLRYQAASGKGHPAGGDTR